MDEAELIRELKAAADRLYRLIGLGEDQGLEIRIHKRILKGADGSSYEITIHKKVA
jgi:hypothetical protein